VLRQRIKNTIIMHNHKWQASRFLKASAALHAGAAASALVWPSTISFGIASLIANHAVLAGAGLWPKSALLGPNVRRLPGTRAEIALTIDDGPDPYVTPRVLDILAEKNIKATFFCIATRLQHHPALVQRMLDEGHHIENHSMRHRHSFSVMGLGGMKKEILQAQQAIEETTGRKPQFFRAPAGLRNPFLDPVLHELELQLVSWTRRGFDTLDRDAQRITMRLAGNAQAGDILLLHDGNAAGRKNGQPVILEVLPQLIDRLTQQNLRFVRVADGLQP
jgi:peptidoglycan/xylan/chitin deacetylase (PgdA/CDA1 family)